MPQNKYTKPQVHHYEYDVNKTWFVSFRYTDSESGLTKQFQFRGEINKQSTKRDKIAEANALRDVLVQMLESGWNPILNKTEKDTTPTTSLIDTLNYLIEIRRNTIKPESTRTYSDVVKTFISFLKGQGLTKILPSQFTNLMARKYLDWCLDKGFGSSSHNKHLSMLITMFNLMIDRQYLKSNPFKGIKPLRRDVGRNIAFTPEERKRLAAIISKENPRLFLFIQFMYFCFMRRTEILRLRVKDIDLNERTILIAYGSGKNRKQEGVSIPSAFLDELKKQGFENENSDHYVFSRKMEVGPTLRKKADYVSDIHREYLRKANISNEKTIYSWKHTGVVELYNEIKDPYALMRQLRHYDLQTTMIYLKSLGLQSNTPVLNSSLSL